MFLLLARRHFAQSTGSGLHILFLNGRQHIRHRQLLGGQLVRLQPDAHGVVFRVLIHAADAGNPLYLVEKVSLGIVLQKNAVISAIG